MQHRLSEDIDNYADAELVFHQIMRLPDGYRTVLNLFAIEGFTHEEIADQLGISVNTSKSQLSRARALLKEKLLKLEDYGQ